MNKKEEYIAIPLMLRYSSFITEITSEIQQNPSLRGYQGTPQHSPVFDSASRGNKRAPTHR